MNLPRAPRPTPPSSYCELLILSDGRILAHNLTPALASILQRLIPDDRDLRRRAARPQAVRDANLTAVYEFPGRT